jgi:hypothetical protein
MVARYVDEQSATPRSCSWFSVALSVYTQELGLAALVSGAVCLWLGLDLFIGGAYSSPLDTLVHTIVLIGGVWFLVAPAVVARRLTWMIRNGELVTVEVQSSSESARSVDANVLVHHPRGSFHDLVHERGSWAPRLTTGSTRRALVHPEKEKVLLYLD